MRVSLTLLLVSLLSTVASARDIFVNNVAGDDSRDGSAAIITGATNGPFRSIARALKACRKGDRVILAKTAQPYRESITLQAARHSGYKNLPFELIGNGAVLDGRSPLPEKAWDHFQGDVYRVRLQFKSRAVLFLDSQPVPLTKVKYAAKSIPTLSPKHACLYRGYLYFRAAKGELPTQYNMSLAAHRVGVTLYQVRNVILRDLVVTGFQLDGVNAHGGVVNGLLLNIESQHHGRAGFSVTGASKVRILNCKSDSKLHTAKPARVMVNNSQLGAATRQP